MAEEPKTFSESWYRIASRRVALRAHVQVRRLFYRGKRYYVLQDPFNNQFSRLRPAAYDFVARLRLDRTVESVWKECMETDPKSAPGQEDVIRLLAQLYAANLLHSDRPPDSAALFERYRTRRQRETKMTLLNVMFARFPLLDPDDFLKAILPLLRGIISPVGALVWLAVVGVAVKVLLDHADALWDQSQSVLAPGNLFLLYCGLLIVKALHEFGHACACRRFGGEVHVMGVMLMIFTPMPYVDTTSSWAFASRWQRAFVGAAGMVAELFVAALAAFVWAYTGPGTINSLAYNMIFVASVSAILFNINPLMRFDGYYILSDLLEIPNLQTSSSQQLIHWVERYLFGCKKSRSPALNRREAFWLCFYGIASKIYRLFLFGAILLFMADRFLILGMVMAVVCAISWVVVPVGKFIHYLASSPRLARNRPRAVAVCSSIAIGAIVALQLVPAPNHFRAPGILEAVEYSILSAESPGRLREILVPSGQRVSRGQPVARMQDRELELDIAAARAQWVESQAMRLRALQEEAADVKPIDSRIEAIAKKMARLDHQQTSLTVRAPHDGLWIAPELNNRLDAWLPRGTQLGQVVNPRSFHFSAIVSQQEASRLFAGEIRGSEVRVSGQAGVALPVTAQRIIPAEQQRLPSAALGWLAGGEVAVDPSDRSGVRTQEPFFQVRATVAAQPPVVLLHGRSGKIRFDLPPEPLLQQWARKLWQLLQKRYAL